jgi:hypothetical protein
MAPKADEMLATLGMELFFRFGRKCFVARYGPYHTTVIATTFRYISIQLQIRSRY